MNDKIYKLIKSKHKRIPDHISKSVANRISKNIISREVMGEFISYRLVNDELIEAFIKSYIRHKETGYDMLLKKACLEILLGSRYQIMLTKDINC